MAACVAHALPLVRACHARRPRVRAGAESSGAERGARPPAGGRLSVARGADTDTLADWLAGGEKGPWPEPIVPAIEAEIKQKTADRDALLVARDRVLEQKEQFVQKNRDRLVRESDRATEEAHKRFAST